MVAFLSDVSHSAQLPFYPIDRLTKIPPPTLQDGDKKELEKMEVYDLQFKFARRETLEDEEMVVCDIPHQSIATSALTGYHLKIWVTEQSKSFLIDKLLQTNFT